MHIPNKPYLRPSIHLSESHEPQVCKSSLTMCFHGRKTVPALEFVFLLVELQLLFQLRC